MTLELNTDIGLLVLGWLEDEKSNLSFLKVFMGVHVEFFFPDRVP